MIDKATLAQMNGEYVMPPDAGPLWRAAHASGMDMSLLEESLSRTPWERLLANERALALIRELEKANPILDGKSD